MHITIEKTTTEQIEVMPGYNLNNRSMKYILIQNDGEIESGAFELIGASTKRNSNSKIGFFGSGLKYSIAFMMRSGISFRIFSGENELLFTTQPEPFRDQSFERICINGSPTSYTTSMGPTWKESWFVLREIYCNAMDEPGCVLVKETDNVNPSTGKTRIYIELTDELKKVLDRWDAYFSMDREVLFKKENIYTSGLGSDDIASKNSTRQSIRIYPKTDGAIFRRGVRVYSSNSYLFDYGFDYVNINEDRTASKAYCIDYAVVNAFAQFVSEKYIVTVLRNIDSDAYSMECSAIKSSGITDGFSTDWVDFSNKYCLALHEKSGRYATEIALSLKEVLFIPQAFARKLKASLPEVKILGMDNQVGEVSYSLVTPSKKMEYLLKETIGSLTEINYPVSHSINIVAFDDDKVLGLADLKTKTILLSERLFDMGRREIALALIEENEHIISGHGDETRAFQNHLLSSWLRDKENAAGLFF